MPGDGVRHKLGPDGNADYLSTVEVAGPVGIARLAAILNRWPPWPRPGVPGQRAGDEGGGDRGYPVEWAPAKDPRVGGPVDWFGWRHAEVHLGPVA